MWVIWSIEALALFLGPVIFTYKFTATTVFFEVCNEWAEEKEGVMLFLDPNEEALKACFLAQDLGFLEKARKAGKEETEFYQVDAEWCKECDSVHTLSLRKIERSWNEKGKEELTPDTIYEDMLVSKEFHEKVSRFAVAKNLT